MTDQRMYLADLLLPSTAADWKQAACAQHPHLGDAWFPFPTQDFDYARAVCADCPIRAACGEFAAATGQTGVWGGREYDRGRAIRD
ncbi:WhiB family transcriptional regulator [Nocardia wallacei]|uniref:WhiB family transcriptional regulator n=1 Tax=Nocardia wallacei TaxID=480035 RepID=UPI003CC7F4AE